MNDQHGHVAGDRVLTEIAKELMSSVRSFDIAYRIGGEEFAIIAHAVTAEVAESMAESVRHQIATSRPAGVGVSMSLGVALRLPGESSKEWYQRCDDALFAAKRGGRNQVQVAGAGLDEPARP